MAASTTRHQPAGTLKGSQTRRDYGAYYTPRPVVEQMVSQLDLTPDAHILEPSGGDGAFVDVLIEHGIPAQQITVWDIDPAVEAAMRQKGVNFELKDSLLDVNSLLDFGDGPGGVTGEEYTHVVGNPPYLNKQSSYIKNHRQKLRRLYGEIGANDTYAMFTYMALGQLKRGGRLVFLISDTFLTLGTHRRFRQHLLSNYQINSITLLPKETFRDASVNTCILDITKQKPGADHAIRFVDCRDKAAGNFDGEEHRVPQHELREHPGTLIVFGQAHETLKAIRRLPPMLDLLDGGLGMHTGDNHRYLAVIETGAPRSIRNWPQQITPDQLDGQNWVPYHKRGGSTPWWLPVEFAVDWRPQSRRNYGIPATVNQRLNEKGEPRPGFLISGVADQLTARAMYPGALWDSNKVFAFFPKDPETYPPTFFIAALNSSVYRKIAKALNHTVSLQIRDLKQLPLLPFTEEETHRLAELGDAAVIRAINREDVSDLEEKINRIADEAWRRVVGQTGDAS